MTTPPVSLFVTTSNVPWVERRPGVFWKTLWEDADGRHKAILMRYEPGATIPRHRHVGDEQIYVLEGSVADDTGVCTAGNYARRPPGLRPHRHQRHRRARHRDHVRPHRARLALPPDSSSDPTGALVGRGRPRGAGVGRLPASPPTRARNLPSDRLGTATSQRRESAS